MIHDRYNAAGLRHNPFAFDVADGADVFIDRGLPAPPPPGSRTMVQLIGDKGAGKTTQLHAWRRARASTYHYVPETPYADRWSRPPLDHLIYADEVDRMPAVLRLWWFAQLSRADSTVVIGTHADLSRQARRAGLKVISHEFGPVDLDTMRAVAHQRVRAASKAGATEFVLDDKHIVRAHERARGSIRAAEGLLHQTVAALVE